MEQDRFDKLAKKVFEARSRRSVVGGAIAGVVGAGVAAVTGASAKDKKSKAKAQGKKGKGKTRGEAVCPANPQATQVCNTLPCTSSADCAARGCNQGCNILNGLCIGAGQTTPVCPPNSCCESTGPGSPTPNCVAPNLQTGSQTCGDPGNGGGVCRTCPTGTRCSGSPNFRCVCDSTSCPTGCCVRGVGTQSDQCIVNGTGAAVNSTNPAFNGATVCGTGGGTCNICSTASGPTGRGCCSATGTCEAGTAATACGTGGGICTNCTTTGGTCSAQTCTGGTTTAGPTTTAAPTTTLAPCGTTRRGKQKVRCGVGATAPCCARCKSDNSGCKKRRKKN